MFIPNSRLYSCVACVERWFLMEEQTCFRAKGVFLSRKRILPVNVCFAMGNFSKTPEWLLWKLGKQMFHRRV